MAITLYSRIFNSKFDILIFLKFENLIKLMDIIIDSFHHFCSVNYQLIKKFTGGEGKELKSYLTFIAILHIFRKEV